jgi:hypothetical protein
MNGKWIGGEGSLTESGLRRKSFSDIPFEIVDPDRQPSISVGLSGSPDSDLPESIRLPVNMTAASVYFLHTASPNHPLAGTISLVYSDGSRLTDYITYDKVAHWWSPEQRDWNRSESTRFVWQSDNSQQYVGFCVYGLNNPHPERTIEAIEFEAAKTEGEWYVVGVTASDAEVYFDPGIASYGIPDNWGAAAVVYALIEGLAGIRDTGVAFDRALLAPRWSAAGVREITATAKYEASGGYVRYRYWREGNQLNLLFATSAAETRVEILLPGDFDLRTSRLNKREIVPEIRVVEESRYACFEIDANGIQEIELTGSSV